MSFLSLKISRKFLENCCFSLISIMSDLSIRITNKVKSLLVMASWIQPNYWPNIYNFLVGIFDSWLAQGVWSWVCSYHLYIGVYSRTIMLFIGYSDEWESESHEAEEPKARMNHGCVYYGYWAVRWRISYLVPSVLSRVSIKHINFEGWIGLLWWCFKI